MGLNAIIPIFQYSIIPLFGATGGATGGGTATAGGTGSAFELSTAGKGKGRHQSVNFFAFTLRAGNLFRGLQY